MAAVRETIYKLNLPIRVALLTDLHERPFGEVHASLLHHRPDIICIAGDMIYGTAPADDALVAERIKDFLADCSSIAPTFVSMGNHEWMLGQEDIEIMEATGAVILDNRWIEWNGVLIGGLSSAFFTAYQKFRQGRPGRYPKRLYRPFGQSGRLQKTAPNTAWLDEFSNAPGFKILLCHHPEYYPNDIKKKNINLILSGHAHGGQIRLFGQGLYAPGQGWFPKLTSGVHDGRLVISRGLANTGGIVPRLFNPTEIVYIMS